MSSVSEQVNGRASGPVLQSVFLAVIDHSAELSRKPNPTKKTALHRVCEMPACARARVVQDESICTKKSEHMYAKCKLVQTKCNGDHPKNKCDGVQT